MYRYAIVCTMLLTVPACKSAKQIEEKYELKSPCASISSTAASTPCATHTKTPLPPKDVTSLHVMHSAV